MLSRDEMATSRRTARSKQPAVPVGEKRERALLETAEKLFREGKYETSSIEDIASAAGISRPTFYFYFASKQALMSSLVDRRLTELTDSLERSIQIEGGPAAQLKATLSATAQLWVDHAVVLAAAVELAGSVPAMFDKIEGVNLSLLDRTVALIMSAGTVPEAESLSSARELTLSLEWMTERRFYVLSRRDPAPEEYYALADRLLVVWFRATGISAESD